MYKVILTLSLLAVSGAQATRYPLTVTDDLGRKVTVKAEPKRIVSLLPSSTETVCALGACDRLVAVDEYSDFPAQVTKLPKVGSLYQPNVEGIVAQKPDLVLVSKYGDLVPALERAGVTVVAVNPEKYDEVFSKTLVIGRLLNRETAAKNVVAKLRADIARVEILTKYARKVRTYFEIDPTPYTVGPNSFMGVLLTKAGAENVIPANLGDFPQISPELVVKQNPALILGVDLATAARRPGWTTIAAVKAGRVRDVPKDLNTILGRPGPRLGEALLGLARIIHPELFR
ncbi:ABC transporter substrate-binding protein [Deinococcus pimensis]|uniref:ABC transporter substrate-binding protein n=1 Tax=Deinococcus pimensis TaxID=309888 RepID=UPI000488FB01|nr:ABC transporter substrate-binding protein [Deinococcus pimensis]